MSFLARIAERALGVAPLVEPLVASRFTPRKHLEPEFCVQEDAERMEAEPAELSGGTKPHGELDPPPADPRPLGEVTRSALRLERPHDGPGSETQPLSRAPQAKGVALGGEPIPARRLARSPVNSKPAAWSEPLEEKPLTPRAAVPPVPKEVHRSSANDMLPRSKLPGPFSQPDAGPRVTPLVPAEPVRPPFQPRVFDSCRAQAQPSPSPAQLPGPAAPPGAEPRLSRLVPMEAGRPPVSPCLFELPSSPQAPAIRVTIGRIEVRAVHPPPPAPRQEGKPQAPGISLDDYLKQFRGGLG
jgi:hypothetical protein